MVVADVREEGIERSAKICCVPSGGTEFKATNFAAFARAGQQILGGGTIGLTARH